MPFACTMRSMNTRRIAVRAGSISSTLNSGMTLSQRTTSLPASSVAASSAALRLPASTTGQTSALLPSAAALYRMTSLLPPSVPPASSRMSGASATMCSTSSRLGPLQALLARSEVTSQPFDHGFDPGAWRCRAVESHVEESFFNLEPGRLADDEIAANVEQDLIETGFHTQIAKAAAVELALAVERGHHDGIGIGFHRRLDEFCGGGQRTESDHLVPRLLQSHRQYAVADDVRIGADDARYQYFHGFILRAAHAGLCIPGAHTGTTDR